MNSVDLITKVNDDGDEMMMQQKGWTLAYRHLGDQDR